MRWAISSEVSRPHRSQAGSRRFPRSGSGGCPKVAAYDQWQNRHAGRTYYARVYHIAQSLACGV
jgi:hypothetical protein